MLTFRHIGLLWMYDFLVAITNSITLFSFIVIQRHFNILVISRLGYLCVYQKAVYFYCCVVNVSFVKFTDFNFMIYEFDEYTNGQMDRGNENPTQHLPWWLRKTTEKNPVRLAGHGIWTRDLPNASLVRYHGATSLVASLRICVYALERGPLVIYWVKNVFVYFSNIFN